MDFLESHWFAIITLLFNAGILKYGYKGYRNYILQEKRKSIQRKKYEETLNGAIRNLLRVEIINICHKAEKDGYLPVWALENLTDMFNIYQDLDGNGSAKKLYEKAITLPQRKDD